MLLAQLAKQSLGKCEAPLGLLVQAAVQKEMCICQAQAHNLEQEKGAEQVLAPRP